MQNMWLTTNIVQTYIYRYIFHYSSGKKYQNNKKKSRNLFVCSIKIASHLYHQWISDKLKIACVHYTGIPCITSLILSVFWITGEIKNSKTISFIFTQSFITKYRTVRSCIIYIVFVTLRFLWLNNLSNTPRIKCSKSFSSAL